MKLKISELCSGCCPENGHARHIRCGAYRAHKGQDAQKDRRSARAPPRESAYAAARRGDSSILRSAACAIVRYNMNLQDVQDQDEVVTGHITEINKNGEVVERQNVVFPGCRSAADLHGSRREL